MLDPQHREPALDQMVLVGHSMGGLVARCKPWRAGKTIGNWPAASRWEQVKADPDVQQKLGETFYFHPNPSIRRVVTIATPHGGSTFSNQTTQYLLDKLIRLPATLVNAQQQLFRDNPRDALPGLALEDRNEHRLAVAQVADPGRDAGQSAGAVGQVQQHHRRGATVLVARHTLGDHTDGVVSVDSARSPDAEPAVIVPDFHMTVHCHPLAVLEVRRILQEHLDELRGHPVVGLRLLPPDGEVRGLPQRQATYRL